MNRWYFVLTSVCLVVLHGWSNLSRKDDPSRPWSKISPWAEKLVPSHLKHMYGMFTHYELGVHQTTYCERMEKSPSEVRNYDYACVSRIHTLLHLSDIVLSDYTPGIFSVHFTNTSLTVELSSKYVNLVL